MALLEPYLTSSGIGRLNLQGAKIDMGMSFNLKSPEVPGSFPSSDTIGAVDFLGWENPVVNVDGIFNHVSNPAFFSKLKSYPKNTASDVFIYDPVYFTSGTQKIRFSALSFTRDSTEGYDATGSNNVKGSIVRYKLSGVLSE